MFSEDDMKGGHVMAAVLLVLIASLFSASFRLLDQISKTRLVSTEQIYISNNTVSKKITSVSMLYVLKMTKMLVFRK